MEWKYGSRRKEEKMEKIQERYMRKMLGVAGRISGYLVREEL